MEKSIENKVKEIFSTLLNKEFGENEEIKKETIEDWDSLFHITLIVTLEDEFEISFDSEDIPNLTSLDAIIEKITELKK